MLEEMIQDIEDIKYPAQGIGCGLEDHCITDRYEAAAYGWNEAMERVAEVIQGYREDRENEL